MKAIEGLFQNDSGQFIKQGQPDPKLARSLMFNARYHQGKAAIMKPIDDFFVLLGDRTKNHVKHLSHTGFQYLFVIIGSIVAPKNYGFWWSLHHTPQNAPNSKPH